MSERPLVIGKGTKQQRSNGVWRYRHNLGKDPVTGKYRYSPWRTIHTTRKSEVDAALEAYKLELNSGVFIKKAPDTVGEYAHRFHESRLGAITPLAYDREAYEIKHIDEIFGNIRLQELRPFMIEDAYAQIRRNGTYSENELHKLHSKLKQALDCAVRDELIAKNPASHIVVPRPKPKERKSLSLIEAARLRDVLLDSQPSAHITAVLLMLGTGMRRGEALGLTWEHVDLENKELYICQQFAKDKSVRSPKSRNSTRRLAIDETLTQYLRDWKALQKSELKSVNLGQTRGTPLVNVLSCDTKRKSMEVNFMDPNCFNKWFRKFNVEHGFGTYEGKRIVRYVRRTVEGETVKKAYNEQEWAELQEQLSNDPGLRHREQIYVYKTETRPYGYQGLSAHMLRHTQATLLIAANADMKTVQSRLGHSSIKMTLDTYSHALAANDIKAASAFESMLDHANADLSSCQEAPID